MATLYFKILNGIKLCYVFKSLSPITWLLDVLMSTTHWVGRGDAVFNCGVSFRQLISPTFSLHKLKAMLLRLWSSSKVFYLDRWDSAGDSNFAKNFLGLYDIRIFRNTIVGQILRCLAIPFFELVSYHGKSLKKICSLSTMSTTQRC